MPLTRFLRQLGLLTCLSLGMLAGAKALPATTGAAPLELKLIAHGPASFNVNSVLILGARDALLLDSGFTRADALRVAAAVLDSGRRLTTIYVSAADPDYYFGLEVLKQEFPEARIVATAPTLAKIKAALPAKLQVWGPRLGANAPRQPVLPEALADNGLSLEGQRLEIRGLDDSLPHRSYVWIPALKAVVGGVNVFAGLHVWTADTQTSAERAAWRAKLDEMLSLQPAIVVPGHMTPGSALDATALRYTRDYLQRFEAELPRAANAAALIEAMKQAYPQAGMGLALDIGAKVNKGEMKW